MAINSMTGKDNGFLKFAFWALGLAAAYMWLPLKDLLLNLLSVVVGAIVVFAVADMVLITIGAISDPAEGVQARIASWLESMKTAPVAPVVVAPVAVAPKAQRPAPAVQRATQAPKTAPATQASKPTPATQAPKPTPVVTATRPATP